MKNLFIIGNGFDLAHDLKTSYLDFKKYVESNDKAFFEGFYSLHMYSFDRKYENPLMTEPINDEYESLWSDIENNMKIVNEDYILSANLELGLEDDNPYYEDCFETAEIYLESFIKDIPERLLENLNCWIQSIDLSKVHKKTEYIDSDSNDLFLTFNYTNVLENVYEVECDRICHIHGEVGDELAMGHLNINRISELEKERDFEYNSFFERKTEEISPEEDEQEKLEQIYEEFQSAEDHYDYKVEQLKYNLLIDYYKGTVKIPKNHIKYNKYFFNQISEVKNIYVIGHSLGDVDMEYFEEILKRVDQKTRWNIFYYGENEKKIFEKKMLEIGIDKKNLIIKHSDLFYA